MENDIRLWNLRTIYAYEIWEMFLLVMLLRLIFYGIKTDIIFHNLKLKVSQNALYYPKLFYFQPIRFVLPLLFIVITKCMQTLWLHLTMVIFLLTVPWYAPFTASSNFLKMFFYWWKWVAFQPVCLKHQNSSFSWFVQGSKFSIASCKRVNFAQ